MDHSASIQEGLGAKIAGLVEERGWSQEEFARRSGLNRLTVRQIVSSSMAHRPRTATLAACAKALGLSLNELRTRTLEQLLASANNGNDPVRERHKRIEWATQPELAAWMERNADRAARLNDWELDELLSLQGVGGPLTAQGVDHFVGLIERKRKLLERVQTVAATGYLTLLEQIVDLLYDKIRPYANR